MISDRDRLSAIRDAREVMARAYYEWATLNPGEESRWDEPGTHQSFALARADVMLGALSDAGYSVVKLEQVTSIVTLRGERDEAVELLRLIHEGRKKEFVIDPLAHSGQLGSEARYVTYYAPSKEDRLRASAFLDRVSSETPKGDGE